MGTDTSEVGSAQKRLGYFGGVFTPSILTILGVIMYMRFGWVVGNAGLAGAILIVVISHLISLSTGLSVSSIATNRTVGAGGAYYMISRALGAPSGAAIGIPLYFGQALSVSFYVVGFSESLELIPWFAGVDARLIGTATCIVLAGISLRSAETAIRIQYWIMAAILLSLVSIFLGDGDAVQPVVDAGFAPRASFGEVFAVFFPAVTGIMVGVSMSGDLKDSRTAIPRGTLLAIGVGFIIYMILPIWLASMASAQTLIDEKDFLFRVAWSRNLVLAGVWGATLSSGLGSLLTAPRTLQALAADGLAPRIFARGSGPTGEPRVGILMTFALAEVGILLGDLDVIAPVLTMFFLATYGVTNLACGLERWAANPSFRPTFEVPYWVSLAGAAGCFYVMSIIHLPAMMGAMLLVALIYVVVQRKALDTTYGDARHGIWSALVRASLHRLRKSTYHPMNWRPNLLIFGGNPDKREHLLKLGSAIVQNRGMISYFHLLEGRVEDKFRVRERLLQGMREQLSIRHPNAFYRVDIVDDVYRGAVQAVQSHGLGTFEANAVLLGWPNEKAKNGEYLQMLRDFRTLDRSILVMRLDGVRLLGARREIHVWWGGFRGNGGLMLLLAYLMTASREWRGASVKVLTIVDSAHQAEFVTKALQETLDNARLDGAPVVLQRGTRTIREIMAEESGKADLAILGLRIPGESQDVEKYMQQYNELLEGLPTTVLVHRAQHFEGEPVLLDGESR